MLKSSQIGVSVIVPVYKSVSTLSTLVSRIDNALVDYSNFEIILIDDGNTTDCWYEILRISASNSNVKGIRLGKNYGQDNALLAGIRMANYSFSVTIDDDLQNPPEEIPRLLNALTGDVDVVFGVSQIRRHSWYRNLASSASKYFLRFLLGVDSAFLHSSFRAFRTEIRKGFVDYVGPNASINALLGWSTSRFTCLEVEHHQRPFGKSTYTIRALLKYFITNIMSYSLIGLRIGSGIGLISLVGGIGVFLWSTIPALVNGSQVPGFPLLAASVSFFSGTIILLLVIIGEYVGKIHFSSMQKPSYYIAEFTIQRKTSHES